jgi:subtilisin family serine protease/subtilisin-like proprotein convertase family protein
MRRRLLILAGAVLLLAVGVFMMFRPSGTPRPASGTGAGAGGVASALRFQWSPATNQTTVAESTLPLVGETSGLPTKTNVLAYRLKNTPKSLRQLQQDDHAVLLENALIDASQPVDFKLPDSLQAGEEPGAYIVVGRRVIDGAFRAAVAGSGASYVSYLPVNSWLVQATAAQAQQLRGNAAVQAVLPWLPVYKLKAELLVQAMRGESLPADAKLNVLAYANARNEVLAQLQQLNAGIVAEERSPFGSVFTVQPNPEGDWLALARLGGVQILERAYPRVSVNDLTRVQIGVAETSTVTTNYLGLTGTNVLVGITDTGVDATHPDLLNRVFGVVTNFLVDSNGHGTHVAGILAGSGVSSTNVIYVRGSSNPATNLQFRGAAPGALLYVQRFNAASTDLITDAALQENTAKTNILISNNSWGYSGNSSYSLAAASYDAAVRDSLPGVTGSQPVLYVFAAGNNGGGSDSGLSGTPDRLLSPATAKNVISVGALELARDITNIVTKISLVGTNLSTNNSTPWKAMTSSENQIARFSSRGNVGIGVEGEFGRFKPDVVAPGTFVVSTRSAQWDEVAYYNPTSHHYTTFSDQVIVTNGLTQYSLFLPDNAVGFSITLVPNGASPVPFPTNLPIYVRASAPPTAGIFDARRTNSLSVPPDLASVGAAVGQSWSYAIGNPNAENIRLDIITDVVTTNDLGNYFQVLSNLNNSICSTNGDKGVPPNFYRYESGTSMAAPAVSGMLALMQEFFEQRLQRTNSPALLKALLINGARSVGNLYDYQVQSTINYQGWGLVKLNNSLAPGITNAFDSASGVPGAIKIFDQSPTNTLATAQSHTRYLTVDNAASILPLRVTLAWTDPPGNPAAGVKLVNDLDLIVTNLDTGEIYLGNDIPGSSIYTAPWDTNLPPNSDTVNNVENVFLSPQLGTNYAVTVLGRRVNANAVTAHPDDVVQDYALVITCGSGEVTNAFAFTNDLVYLAPLAPDVTHVTNTITQPDFVAAFLENQRVSANSPLLGTTNGVNNQWKFYVVTNDTGFTNAAFLLAQQTDLAIPRMGVSADAASEATRRYADLDLYVSTDSNLTNLSPVVLDAAFKSLSRNEISGDELIILTNAQTVYYVGVKSEDYQAGQYDFFAIFSLLPLGAEDANGFVRAYPMTGYAIPDGSPSQPGGTRFLAVPSPSLSGRAESVRRVVITNNVSHENYGDIISAVSHNSRTVVLDNHRSLETPPYPVPPGPYSFLYDDSGQGDFLNVIPPSGPGTFETYMGEAPGGVWYFSYSDDALTQSGNVNDLRLRLDRQCEDNCDGVTNEICAGRWIYFSRNVPVEATNLTVCIDIITANNPQPLDLYIRKGRRPTLTAYDFRKTINPPGSCLTIDKSQLPPLTAGRYFIGVFNPNTSGCETFVYESDVELGPPPTPIPFNGTGNQALLDDAVTNFTQFVSDDAQIARLDVGLRIDHPRVSDLAVTLISPKGTRVLLVENRGGTTAGGFGSSLTVTNFTPVDAGGGQAGQTNFIDTGSVMGSVTIDYDFYQAPDQMRVYYENNLLADTGMVGGAGRLTLNYGPGSSTIVEVRMNEFGNTNTQTLWNYTVSSYNTANSYLTFTDNTNLTTTPVKFALPPFVGNAGTNYLLSDFEPSVLAQDYTGVTAGTPDNWSIISSNTVTVITNTANTGTNSLALRAGHIRRDITTTPGRGYRLGYGYRRQPNLDGLIAWWPGENNTIDIINANNGVIQGGMGYGGARVGQGFSFTDNDDGVFVAASTNLVTTNMTIETWIYPTDNTSIRPIVEYANPSGMATVHFSYNWNGGFAPGALWGLFRTPAGTLAVSSAAGVLPLNQWSHVALTFDFASRTGRLYRNGILVGTAVSPVAIIPQTGVPFYIGYRSNTSGELAAGMRHRGLLDEVSIFNRALNSTEVAAIFAAGATGKCGMAFPPAICAPAFGAQAFVPGVVTNAFLGTTNWQQGGIFFNATDTNTTVLVSPLRSGQHVYEFVRTNLTWTNAQAAAAAMTPPLPGYRAHLAAITSAAENEFIRTGLSNALSIYGLTNGFAWIAGNEPTNNGNWQWSAGPEAGMQFSTNATPTLPFFYANWGSNQPNDAVTGEDYLMFNLGPTNSEGVAHGQWADGPPTPGAPNSVVGFIVEYEPDQPSGVLVDTFTLTELASPRYVLPEEALGAFVGENAYGTWQLEVLDTRTGMTNNVNLVDWQLQFVYQTNTAVPRIIDPGVPVDVTLPPGQIIYFIVDVPSFARFATNILFNSDQDLGFYFNQNIPPSYGATNAINGDVIFASPTRNWTETLSTTNTVPPTSTKADLLPGQRYYLAVENLSAVNATFVVYVDFDLRTLPPFVDLTNGVPLCNEVNPFPFSLNYYRFVVSSNAVRAQFEIDNPSGDMTLLLRRGLPPALGVFDYLSANVSTNDEFVTVFDFSQPVPLTPGDWYFAAVNLSTGPVTYCAGAWEWLSYGTNIVITNVFLGTNSLCLTWTSLPGVRYYIEGLTNLSSTNWVTASPTITGTGYSTTYCVPLPSPLQFFRVREGQALNTFVPQPYITRILKRFNGVEITWSGPPGQQYKVEWSESLVPAVWTQFTETITSTTGIYQYLDDGSQTGGFDATRYYRLVLLP